MEKISSAEINLVRGRIIGEFARQYLNEKDYNKRSEIEKCMKYLLKKYDHKNK